MRVRERALLGRSAMIDRVRTKSIRRESIWRKMRIALLANGRRGSEHAANGRGHSQTQAKDKMVDAVKVFSLPLLTLSNTT